MMYDSCMSGMGMGNFGFGGMIFMSIFWIAFLGLIIWLIYQLIIKNKTNSTNSKDSINIVKERYAKGEITKKEYLEMKKEL